LRVAEKRKESAGAALEAVHSLICDLILNFLQTSSPSNPLLALM